MISFQIIRGSVNLAKSHINMSLPVLRSAAARQVILGILPATAQCRHMSLWYMAKKKVQQAWQNTIKMETPTLVSRYGIEAGTAQMLTKMGARVCFTNGKWYDNKDIKSALQTGELHGECIEAVDAKETDLDQFGMVDVVKLSQLKYLSLEGCPLIDDHCLASLVHLRDTLTHLNINGCPEVTENGVATLHKLRKLQRLNMNNLPKVDNAPLTAVMLEDVLPNLRISLVSQQVQRFVDDIKRGQAAIDEHKKRARMVEDGKKGDEEQSPAEER